MDRLLQLGAGGLHGMGQPPPGVDTPMMDTTETVYILSLALLKAPIHGLGQHYYSLPINYRKNELEYKMLSNLQKKAWMNGLQLEDFQEICTNNEQTVKEMLELAKSYNKALEDEEDMTPEQLAIRNVRKLNPKRHLEKKVEQVLTNNITQTLGAMLDTVVFS